MSFGHDRSRRAGRFLIWKVRIFSVGAVLALAGIYLDERWMTLTAMGVLIVGILLRFLPDGWGRGAGGEVEEEDEEDEEENQPR